MKKTEQNTQSQKAQKAQIVVGTRGRTFEGFVVRKFPKRVTIEFERTVYIQKYERFLKKKMRIHARLPEGMAVDLGDLVKVRESRPLSKIIHFVVIEKVRSAQEGK